FDDHLTYYRVTTTGDGTSTHAGGTGTQADPFQYATLLGAVNAADADGGIDTITFAPALTSNAPATIDLSTVGDGTAGPSDRGVSGLVTIEGPTGNNGISLQNTGSGQRLFYVSATGGLTVENLTLEGGQSQGGDGGSGGSGGGGAAGLGGAVF